MILLLFINVDFELFEKYFALKKIIFLKLDK